MGTDILTTLDVDIKENTLLELDSKLLNILLKDNSSGKNIIWGTDEYLQYSFDNKKNTPISIYAITGENGDVIKPRTKKTKIEQQRRVVDKGEVFTPSWICNKQNNLVDNAWFGKKNLFNTETEKSWIPTSEKIPFPTEDGKTWQDYVKSNRLEITCGEAPYLASRYDMLTGESIPVKERIGILDRKLRVVSENLDDEPEWYEWAQWAVKSVYGYDWQGDNVLLARENILFTFCDYYEDKFGTSPSMEKMLEVSQIISWNIWQMDGLKYVIPDSCHNSTTIICTLFGEQKREINECPGCRDNVRTKHNGIYCYIMDWEMNKRVKFVNLVKN